NYSRSKAAGGVLTAKQAPHRPGTAPAPGLRAERAAVILSQTTPPRRRRTMSFRSILAALWPVPTLPRARSAGRRAGIRPRRPSLAVEALEDRTVPSAFTVLNLADGGEGSLRAAVLAANTSPGADVIDFAPGLTGTIGLTGGQLDVTDDLTIDGPGAGVLAVSGSDASRVFRIGSGVTVAIDDLTITHGRADNGGGIWNASGSLSLSHVIVSQNQALGAPGNLAQGGGVFNQGGALTVEHSTFSGNVAIGGLRLGAPVTQGRGGGIDSDQG